MKWNIWSLGLTLVWVAIIVSLFVALPANMNGIFAVTGALLLIAHLVEFFVFRQRIAKKQQGIATQFILTLIYGVIYIQQRP